MESNICNCPLQNPSIAVADNCPIHNKAATALPEELVSKHMEAVKDISTESALYDNQDCEGDPVKYCQFIEEEDFQQLSQAVSAITIDYLGRFAECCESIVINNETWKRQLVINTYYWVKFVSPTVIITTPQLITLFFNSHPTP